VMPCDGFACLMKACVGRAPGPGADGVAGAAADAAGAGAGAGAGVADAGVAGACDGDNGAADGGVVGRACLPPWPLLRDDRPDEGPLGGACGEACASAAFWPVWRRPGLEDGGAFAGSFSPGERSLDPAGRACSGVAPPPPPPLLPPVSCFDAGVSAACRS
jgi:hypothetical protein